MELPNCAVKQGKIKSRTAQTTRAGPKNKFGSATWERRREYFELNRHDSSNRSQVLCEEIEYTRKNFSNTPTKCTYIYIFITVYLPHSCYTFRCAIRHLQGGILEFLLKATSFALVLRCLQLVHMWLWLET